MEPVRSLAHSQQLTTCHCPEPEQSNPRLPILFLNIYIFGCVKGMVIPANVRKS
jgi:hypothetical protein